MFFLEDWKYLILRIEKQILVYIGEQILVEEV